MLNKSDQRDDKDKVTEVAKIILKDIENKLRNFDKSAYPSTTNFFSNVEQYIPSSLNALLSHIICCKKENKNKRTRDIKKNW